MNRFPVYKQYPYFAYTLIKKGGGVNRVHMKHKHRGPNIGGGAIQSGVTRDSNKKLNYLIRTLTLPPRRATDLMIAPSINRPYQ